MQMTCTVSINWVEGMDVPEVTQTPWVEAPPDPSTLPYSFTLPTA